MTIEQAHDWVRGLSNGGDVSTHLTAEQIEMVGEVLKEIRAAGCSSCSTSACTTSRSTARRPPSRAARASASAWPARLAAGWWACSTSWTSPPSACTPATSAPAGHAAAAARHGQHRAGGRARRRDHAHRRLAGRPGPGRGRAWAARWSPPGTPDEVAADPHSLTGRYLCGELRGDRAQRPAPARPARLADPRRARA